MRDPSSLRDHRIDVLRGLALLMIFVNHVPDNVLSAATSRNFGFSDAAEGFVLLSGISAGLAYAPRSRPGAPRRSPLAPWKRAFTLWWVQALIVLTIFLMLFWTQHLPGIAEMAAERNVTPALDDPAGLLAPLLLLTHQFNCADILPLYILFLLATPFLIALAWRAPLVAVIGSGLLWLWAGWWSANLRTWPTDHGWFFNPLSWQFLFVIGLVTGLAKSRGQRLVPVHPVPVMAAAGLLLYSLLWLQVPALAETGKAALDSLQGQLGSPNFLTSFDKTFLAPLRLLHVLALAYVLSALPALHGVARSRWARPIASLGRNALPVFAVSTVLAYGVQILREVLLTPPLADLLLLGIGINLMLLVALILDRRGKTAPNR